MSFDSLLLERFPNFQFLSGYMILLKLFFTVNIFRHLLLRRLFNAKVCFITAA